MGTNASKRHIVDAQKNVTFPLQVIHLTLEQHRGLGVPTHWQSKRSAMYNFQLPQNLRYLQGTGFWNLPGPYNEYQNPQMFKSSI